MKIKPWIEAMRLRTLPVSVAGVLGGTASAAICGGVKWIPATLCLIFAILAQIASNFGNEYYDYKGGFDRKGREGFRRGVTEGDISPNAMKYATYGTLALACAVGCALIYWGGWWLIPVGICIALFALAYSTGPWPLSHHGLGDIAVVIFFGLVPVFFTCYVQVPDIQNIYDHSLLIGGAIGLMAANVLIVNNYRDMEDDAATGKHTTVVKLGRKTMSSIYLVGGLLAFLLFWSNSIDLPAWWMYATFPFVIMHIVLYTKLIRRRGAALNPMLGLTAIELLGVSALTFAAALTEMPLH